MLKIEVVMAGSDVGREPMAGSVDAVMGCGSGRLFVRHQAVAGGFGEIVGVVFVAFAMFMPCMAGMMAHAGCRLWAHRCVTMIAAAEDAVREHVQAGQDGDQGSHVELEGQRAWTCRGDPARVRQPQSSPFCIYRANAVF